MFALKLTFKPGSENHTDQNVEYIINSTQTFSTIHSAWRIYYVQSYKLHEGKNTSASLLMWEKKRKTASTEAQLANFPPQPKPHFFENIK